MVYSWRQWSTVGVNGLHWAAVAYSGQQWSTVGGIGVQHTKDMGSLYKAPQISKMSLLYIICIISNLLLNLIIWLELLFRMLDTCFITVNLCYISTLQNHVSTFMLLENSTSFDNILTPQHVCHLSPSSYFHQCNKVSRVEFCCFCITRSIIYSDIITENRKYLYNYVNGYSWYYTSHASPQFESYNTHLAPT